MRWFFLPSPNTFTILLFRLYGLWDADSLYHEVGSCKYLLPWRNTSSFSWMYSPLHPLLSWAGRVFVSPATVQFFGPVSFLKIVYQKEVPAFCCFRKAAGELSSASHNAWWGGSARGWGLKCRAAELSPARASRGTWRATWGATSFLCLCLHVFLWRALSFTSPNPLDSKGHAYN